MKNTNRFENILKAVCVLIQDVMVLAAAESATRWPPGTKRRSNRAGWESAQASGIESLLDIGGDCIDIVGNMPHETRQSVLGRLIRCAVGGRIILEHPRGWLHPAGESAVIVPSAGQTSAL